MKRFTPLPYALIAAVLVLLTNVASAEPAGWTLFPSTNSAAATSSPSMRFIPPLRGMPKRRIGGGTRAPGEKLPTLSILAPESLAWTLQRSPTLYWRLSTPFDGVVELTIVVPGEIEPLLERRLEGPFAAGIHTVDLNAYGLLLEPTVEYEWYLALVLDPMQRSADIVAGAALSYHPIDLPPIRTCRPSSVGLAATYAAAGYWLDAFHCLEGAAPRFRRQLLEQVEIR